MEINEIEVNCFRLKQGIAYKFIGVLNNDVLEYKIKIYIERDSYDSQSSAIIYVWNQINLTWNTIDYIPYKMIQTSSADIYSDKLITIKHFEKDVKTLLRLAENILFN